MREIARRQVLLAAAAVILPIAACGSPGSTPAQDEEPPATLTTTTSINDSALTAAIQAGEQQALSQLPPGAGRDVIREACLICHDAAIIELQRKDRDGWTRTVGGMVDWGAPVSAEQQEVVVDYLVQHFGPERSATP